jgi:hypothetical protein
MKLLKPYKDSGAERGEVCPLCGTKMNEGANLCTGCRAMRRITTKGVIFVVLQGIFGVLAGIGIFIGGGMGLIVLIVTAVTEKGRANFGEGLIMASYEIGLAIIFFSIYWLIVRISPKKVMYFSR